MMKEDDGEDGIDDSDIGSHQTEGLGGVGQAPPNPVWPSNQSDLV